MTKKKKLTTDAEKSGRRGGLQTLKKLGTSHFSRAAKARWDIHRSKKVPLHKKKLRAIIKEEEGLTVEEQK